VKKRKVFSKSLLLKRSGLFNIQPMITIKQENKMKKIIILVFILALLTPTIALACPPPADCSPGFWKNHTEIWEGSYDPDDEWEDSGLSWIEALQGGYATRTLRFEVTDYLNTAFPYAACD
jgi:hypothetical protein